MVYVPSNSSFSAQFFAYEASKLSLPNGEELKELTEGIITQCQNEILALQSEENVSEEAIYNCIETATQKIRDILNDRPQYQEITENFVRDVREKLIPKDETVPSRKRSSGSKMKRHFAAQQGITETSKLALSSIEPSAIPPYVTQTTNQILNGDTINIDGYSPDQTIPPGEPLPTNSWWTLLADERGSGILGLLVVPDTQTITDPRGQIHLSDALLFDPQITLGKVVSIPYAPIYPPNVNQGVYNVKSDGNGFTFSQSEQFGCVTGGGASTYTEYTPYSMTAAAAEQLLFPPTVITQDDNSVTLLYRTKEGGSMTVPLVRGSPYLTFQYEESTPYFSSNATPIDMNTVHAYFYKQVVATVSDPKTQISQSEAAALGLESTLGSVVEVENKSGPPWTGGIEGQVFSYSMIRGAFEAGDSYRMYFSSPVTLNACNYVNQIVIPESIPIPNPNPLHYVHDSSVEPYTVQQLNNFSQSHYATGLEASSPFSGTARVIKIPRSVNIAQDDTILKQTIQLFDKNAWAIPTSSHYQVDDLGKWSYTYEVDSTINPYATLGFNNPPLASSGTVLIGLLKTDFSYLEGAAVVSDQIYVETIKGELEFVEATNNKISFYDSDANFGWPDDALAQLSSEDQIDLANQYINIAIPDLWLPDRNDYQITYNMGKDIQNAADSAHALWKLGELNPAVKNIPGYQDALEHALHIAEAGLDDYLTGGYLAYDSTNGMMISQYGQTADNVDYYNAYGTDHHFSYGYLIRSAAEIREIDPGWFQDPTYGEERIGMVNLLVADVFNVQDNSGFPRNRMWDSYVGIGRATGLVSPAAGGMNEESTSEDYNCIQAISMWSKMEGNTDLQIQAATMADRVKNAAHAYWQPHSSTSIYTDDYAPDAAKQFADNTISSGVNWDNIASSANFFTPPYGDPNIYTIAIQCIPPGDLSFLDEGTALAAFDYLINSNDSSGFARIFQQNIPTPGAAYSSFITILLPLIAKTSPNIAEAILNWYQEAHVRDTNIYSYDNGNNYAVLYQQILMARATNTNADPCPSPEAFASKLPPLPAPRANALQPLERVQGAILAELSYISAEGRALFTAVSNKINQLKTAGENNVQAFSNWLNDFLPTIAQQYPNLTEDDKRTFCRAAQLDIHTFE